MSATEADFVRALCDDPDDDDRLLVFADWLDDQGDPRAEVLRIQWELSRWVPDLARRTELQAREAELSDHLEPYWIGPLRDYAQSWRRKRGLAYITLKPRAALNRSFRALARDQFLPAWVGGLRLVEDQDALERILSHGKLLRGLAALDLSGCRLTGHLLEMLLVSPHLDALRHLDLSGCHLDPGDAHRLAGSPLLQRLHTLELRNNPILGFGLKEILRRAAPTQLRRLGVLSPNLPRVVLHEWRSWQARQPRRPHERDGPSRLTNSIGMAFARVPAGSFLMGSPKEEHDRYDDETLQHAVTLTRPFYLGLATVTQWQFAMILRGHANPSHFHSEQEGSWEHPVDSVTWDEADEFCRRLSALPDERDLGHRYRLPTEAEWEHACRAGTTTPFFFGRQLSSREANFDGNFPYGGAGRGPYLARTIPSGYYSANDFGLFDMHGNLWEWCADWFDEYAYHREEAIDPTGPRTGSRRVLRGGSWFNNAGSCRSAYRYFLEPDERDNHVGFRVVLEVPADDHG